MEKEKKEYKVMVLSALDKDGNEIPDPNPIALPVDFERPPTIAELVQRLVRYEMSNAAGQEGEETFEEADDFEVGDEPELRSPYELDDEQVNARIGDFIEEEPKAAVPKTEPEEDPQPEAKETPTKGKGARGKTVKAASEPKARRSAAAPKETDPDEDPEE